MNDPNGFLNINKIKGCTSHDCVKEIRRIFNIKKVGHTGTLDPEVSGVLPIAMGEATKLISLMKEERHDESSSFVRVGVNSGGCSGLSYDLGFDDKESEDDKSFEDNGVKIVVNKKSYLYLIGTVLEYSGGLNGKGFVFINPNASRTCGCGESFSL